MQKKQTTTTTKKTKEINVQNIFLCVSDHFVGLVLKSIITSHTQCNRNYIIDESNTNGTTINVATSE